MALAPSVSVSNSSLRALTASGQRSSSDYNLFKSQYDAQVNAILYREKHGKPAAESIMTQAKTRPPSRLKMPDEVKESVKHRDGYRCLCCGEERKRRLHMDHIVPLDYGGLHEMDNIPDTLSGVQPRKARRTMELSH